MLQERGSIRHITKGSKVIVLLSSRLDCLLPCMTTQTFSQSANSSKALYVYMLSRLTAASAFGIPDFFPRQLSGSSSVRHDIYACTSCFGHCYKPWWIATRPSIPDRYVSRLTFTPLNSFVAITHHIEKTG